MTIYLFYKILLALVLLVIVLIKIDVALVILIFSMLLSPEYELGNITGRTVVLRADDIFILVIFVCWLTKIAIKKEFGFLKSTPLNLPIFAFMSVCFLSTALGILRGGCSPNQSFFYLLKYFEYFLLYFMVVNSMHSARQAKCFVFCMLLVCFIVSIYARWTYLETGVRATAPFEGRSGEANTLGGYLLLMISIGLGMLLYSKSVRKKIMLSVVLSISCLAFIYTKSRGAWLGFFPMYLALIFISKRAKLFLLLGLLCIIVFPNYFFPKVVRERVQETFIEGDRYTVFGRHVDFDESASARIEKWGFWLEKWTRSPLLGYGVPGGNIVGENQYVRVLVETGLTGFIIFAWLMVSVFRSGWAAFNNSACDDTLKGLCMGYLAGFAGLLTQSLTAETFIIIRIMEPFWFLTAIVVFLSQIKGPQDRPLHPEIIS